MKYYKLTLEILSPVYIGSGKVIGKAEYVYDKAGKRIMVMNNARLFDGLSKRLGMLREYEKLLIEGGNGVYKSNLMTLFIKRQVPMKDIEAWTEYSYSAKGNAFDDRACSEINAFMRDNYLCPYIPGSSLKGALRTVLMNYEVSKRDFNAEAAQAQKVIATGDRKKYIDKDLARISDAIECEIAYTLNRNKKKREDILNDCFRYLRVSDSKPLSNDDIILCKKIDVTPNGDESSPNLFRECLRPGAIAEFDVAIDERYFKYTIDDIRAAMKYMDKNYCDKFLSNFDKVEPFVKVEPMDDRLYLGGGAGYLTKTFTYSLFDEKTAVRNVARYFQKTTPKEHKHFKDESLGVSPHSKKATLYEGEWVDFGLCYASFKEIKY